VKNHFNSEQIYLFSIVVDQGSFLKAAHYLGVNVSTVMRHINNLEKSIGAKLFIRSSHYLGLTESGHHLYGKAQGILKELSDIVEEVKAIEQSESGVIQVSCLPTFGKIVIIPFLADNYLKEHNVHINFHFTERLVNPIVERLDLAIRIGKQPDSSLYAKKIGVQTWHICASPELLKQFSSEHIEQFKGLPLIDKCTENSSLCWKGIEKLNVISSRCDDFHAQLMLAIAGIGFCCLPNWVISSSIANGQLIKVMDDPFDRSEPIYALRPFPTANPKLSQFMASIESSLATLSHLSSFC